MTNIECREANVGQEDGSGTRPHELEGFKSDDVDWNGEASRLLKSVLVRYGVSSAELASMLAEKGVPENEKGVNAKLRRGGFSVAYLIQCMTALGVDTLNGVMPRGAKRVRLRASRKAS